jgi:hypothetical protein
MRVRPAATLSQSPKGTPAQRLVPVVHRALVQILSLPILGRSDEQKAVRWPGSWVCCAKNVFYEHGAVPEMKEGPSEPACRSRLQTAVSCFGPKGRGGERYGQKA